MGHRVMHFVIPEPNVKPPEAAPPAARQAKTKEALIRAGGKRLPVNLPAEVVQAVEIIKARDGFKTNSEAIIAALRHYARYVR